jgi:hypothetical protein
MKSLGPAMGAKNIRIFFFIEIKIPFQLTKRKKIK